MMGDPSQSDLSGFLVDFQKSTEVVRTVLRCCESSVLSSTSSSLHSALNPSLVRTDHEHSSLTSLLFTAHL